MTLDEYKTFDEKKKFFKNGETVINVNINQIFEKIEEFQKNKGSFVYRGCNEAKHMLYCSAQRLYINQDLHKQVAEDSISEHYRKFITELIETCKTWNNGVVKKLLVHSGINENNSLAYLSYMQHFGVPTPFLDFTFNPYVALFFAVDSISYKPSDNEIDNYFSLYYTWIDNKMVKIWQYVFDKNLEKENISYESVDKNNMSILLPDNGFYKIINSVNIINQEGLFFYNNHPWYPLERTYSEHVDHTLGQIGREKFDKLLMLDTFAGCFNIHKSLVPAIKRKLAEVGITKAHIYPDTMHFKESVTNEGIFKSLTLKK